MKETLKISDRFCLSKKLGQGTFSFIYEAYDRILKKNVALKIEKKDKNKTILYFEYNVLNVLKGLKHVCNVHDFVKNSEQNLIVMDLLGNNLAKVRKCLEDQYSLKIAIQLLIEMLDAIEEVHDRGFIHRDVKASNFVLSCDNKHVYIVDFGLAKKHLDDNKMPVAQRKKADFRGTVSFASLNAHNNIDLSRRDDLWSLYFVILDFLNEKLKWREQKEYTMDEVKNIKIECLGNPNEKLWHETQRYDEVKIIFEHLNRLSYKDKPDYELIRNQLKSISIRNTDIPQIILNPQDQDTNNFVATTTQVLIPSQAQHHIQLMNYSTPQSQLIAPTGYVSEYYQTPDRLQTQRYLQQNQQMAPQTPQTYQGLMINEEGGQPLGQQLPNFQNYLMNQNYLSKNPEIMIRPQMQPRLNESIRDKQIKDVPLQVNEIIDDCQLYGNVDKVNIDIRLQSMPAYNEYGCPQYMMQQSEGFNNDQQFNQSNKYNPLKRKAPYQMNPQTILSDKNTTDIQIIDYQPNQRIQINQKINNILQQNQVLNQCNVIKLIQISMNSEQMKAPQQPNPAFCMPQKKRDKKVANDQKYNFQCLDTSGMRPYLQQSEFSPLFQNKADSPTPILYDSIPTGFSQLQTQLSLSNSQPGQNQQQQQQYVNSPTTNTPISNSNKAQISYNNSIPQQNGLPDQNSKANHQIPYQTSNEFYFNKAALNQNIMTPLIQTIDELGQPLIVSKGTAINVQKSITPLPITTNTSYTYHPEKMSKQKSQIFKVEKDQEQYNRIYQQSSVQLVPRSIVCISQSGNQQKHI